MKSQVIGNRYRIKSLIGEGGMASVYAAVDEKLDREVAIKIMHQHLARNVDIRERFLLEARTVSTLDHPNILKVYDFSGLDAEQLWIVTEILHGVDLAEYVKRFAKNRLHPLVCALIVREICRALLEVHKLKIVHRDVKPENIMVLHTGGVKLMDFGIAKVHRANATQTGTFMGSPSYMSPEQIRGADVDLRADIYSLCVLFYEVVTGSLPYYGQSTAEVINRIMQGRYTAPEHLAPGLPHVLSDCIKKGLENAKEDRFSSIQEVGDLLDAFIKESGFGESRIELERFVLHRKTFEKRLSQLAVEKPSLTEIDLDETIFNPEAQKITRARNPDVTEIFMPPARAKAVPPEPKPANHVAPSEGRPVEGRPRSQTENRAEAESKSKSRSPTEFESKKRSRTEVENRTEADERARLEARARADGEGQRRPKAEAPDSPKRTRVESSRSDAKPSPQPVRKIFIREYVSGDRVKREPSTFLYLATLLAAIGLVFLIGGDRLMNRLKRDSNRLSQYVENPNKKVPAPRPGDEGTSKPPVPAQAPRLANDTKEQENEEPPIVVESETVTIDGKNPPKVGKKERATLRPTRPVAANAPKSSSLVPPKKSGGTDILPVQNAPEKAPNISDSIPQETVRERGTLRIAALPAAEILIDGKLLGTTNDREIINSGLKLDPGSYQLKLRRKGYKLDEQTVVIRSGEQKQMSVSLTRTLDLVELTVRSNRLPAAVLIEDLRQEGRRLELTLNRKTKVFNLKPGQYRVVVSYGRDTINRVIDLEASEEAQTFNAVFK